MFGITERHEPTVKKQTKLVRNGVAASLSVRPRGRVRIVLDDIRESGAGWRVTRLYTWKDVRARDLKEMSISERDLANLGLAVVARLRAVWEQADRMADRERTRKPTIRRAK